MALRNQPYLPLYVQDFMTDEKLANCCAESQGVYIWLMCILHKSQEYGKITLREKDRQSGRQSADFALRLSRQMPFPADVIERSLKELLEEGVISVGDGALYQKRMVRDGELSAKRADAGRKGARAANSKAGFAPAKMPANPENENESESENEIVSESENENENGDVNGKRQGESGFEEFWQAYPKKTGIGRAREVWRRLRPDGEAREKILRAVGEQKGSAQWKRENGRFIPKPENWLSGECWNDVLPGGGERRASYDIDELERMSSFDLPEGFP